MNKPADSLDEILKKVWDYGHTTNPYPYSNDLIAVEEAKQALEALIATQVLGGCIDELKLKMYRTTVTNFEARVALTKLIRLLRWTRQIRGSNYYK